MNRLARLMEKEMVKRLMWSGLLAVASAIASALAQRTASRVWRQLFEEEPPE